MRTLACLLLAGTAVTIPTMAMGQSGGDVVVMRRVIAPPTIQPSPTPTPPTGTPTPTPGSTPTPGPTGTPTPTPTGTPTPAPAAATWVAGDWTYAGTNTCTATAAQTRTVSCQAGGEDVPAARCTGTKPATSQTVERTEGCTYSWTAGAYSAFDSTCADAATRTQTTPPKCMRSDSTVAGDDRCDPGQRPSEPLVAPVYTGCRVDWTVGEYGPYDSTCSDTARRVRPVQCQRTGERVVTTLLSDDKCNTEKPQSVSDYETVTTSCTYDPTYGSPYGSCTADSPGSATGKRTAALTQCVRSDHSDKTQANIDGGYKLCAASRIESCTKTYTGTYGAFGACHASSGGSATGTQTASLTACKDEAGNAAPNAACAATQTQACPVTYTPTYGAFGYCSPNSSGSADGTQTQTVNGCTASDGSTVSNAYCSPQTKSRSCTVTYTPTYGTYGSCTPTTGGSTSGTQTQPITSCVASDYTYAPNSACSPQSNSKSCTLTYTPTYGSFGACSNGTQSAPITSCTTNGSDGTSSSVNTAYCSPQTNTKTCASIGNANFEANTHWNPSTTGSGQASYVMQNGSRAMMLVGRQSSDTGQVSQNIALTAGVTYDISFQVWIASGSYCARTASFDLRYSGSTVARLPAAVCNNAVERRTVTYKPTVTGNFTLILASAPDSNQGTTTVFYDNMAISER